MGAQTSLASPLPDNVAPIPLPATLVFLLAAVGGLAGLVRRKTATE
ncbi:VPLPA-CTERM sorting domain-containing protein [Palleronia sp.]